MAKTKEIPDMQMTAGRCLCRMAIAILVSVVSACASPTKTEMTSQHEVSLDLKADELIVLFPNQSRDAPANVRDFVDCVKSKFAEQSPAYSRIADTFEFQDALFPWFEPGHAPQTALEMDRLLAMPIVRERVDALKVRYLVSVAVSQYRDGFPGMLCGAAMGGGGCLGAGWEESETNLSIIFWDMKSGKESGDLSLSTSGNSLAIGIIVPIVFKAYTEEDSCEAFAAHLESIISGSIENE